MNRERAVVSNRKFKALRLAPLIFCLSFFSRADEDVNLEACTKYLEPSLVDKLSDFFSTKTDIDLNYKICIGLVNTKYFKDIDTDYERKSLSDPAFRDLILIEDSSVSTYGGLENLKTLQNDSATFKVIGSLEPSKSDGQDHQDIETVRGFSTIQNQVQTIKH